MAPALRISQLLIPLLNLFLAHNGSNVAARAPPHATSALSIDGMTPERKRLGGFALGILFFLFLLRNMFTKDYAGRCLCVYARARVSGDIHA